MLKQLGFTANAVLNAPLNRKDRLRAVGRYLGWQLKARTVGRDVVPFVNDTHLAVRRGMVGATGNIYCGLHEFEEMGFALHLLRPGDVFLDIGANVGSYSILAWAVGAFPFAFEPGERFEDLNINFRLNDVKGDTYRAAVGAEPGSILFTRGLDAVGRPALKGEAADEVPMVTLDLAVPAEFPAPLLMKVDVEGYEAAVIAGGEHMLRETPPLAIIMEVGQGERFGYDDAKLARRMTAEFGYEAAAYDPFTRDLASGARGVNTIYVRDFELVQQRLRDAAPFRVLNREI